MARDRRWLGALSLLGFLALFWSQPGFAQSGDEIGALQREVEALKEGQRAILRQLDELQSLLQQRRAPDQPAREVVLGADGAAALGDERAKVTLIEFSDYQCPFCRRYALKTMPKLVEDYIETGKLRYVFRDFPILSLHPAAFEAAVAARCAGEQGKYWQLHDRFFADQKGSAVKDWAAHAGALSLDGSDFQACLESGRYTGAVRRDMAEGRRAGVRGTPTFFLGLTGPDGATLKATRKLVGARPYDHFRQAIDALLADVSG